MANTVERAMLHNAFINPETKAKLQESIKNAPVDLKAFAAAIVKPEEADREVKIDNVVKYLTAKKDSNSLDKFFKKILENKFLSAEEKTKKKLDADKEKENQVKKQVEAEPKAPAPQVEEPKKAVVPVPPKTEKEEPKLEKAPVPKDEKVAQPEQKNAEVQAPEAPAPKDPVKEEPKLPTDKAAEKELSFEEQAAAAKMTLDDFVATKAAEMGYTVEKFKKEIMPNYKGQTKEPIKQVNVEGLSEDEQLKMSIENSKTQTNIVDVAIAENAKDNNLQLAPKAKVDVEPAPKPESKQADNKNEKPSFFKRMWEKLTSPFSRFFNWLKSCFSKKTVEQNRA